MNATAIGAHLVGSVGELIGNISNDLSTLFRQEVELAKAELVPAAKHAGIGGAFFGGAGMFAIHAVWMFVIALALTIGGLVDRLSQKSA